MKTIHTENREESKKANENKANENKANKNKKTIIIKLVRPMRQHQADLSAKGVPLRAFHTTSGDINIRLASRLPSPRCPLKSNDVVKSNREVFFCSAYNPQQAPAIHKKKAGLSLRLFQLVRPMRQHRAELPTKNVSPTAFHFRREHQHQTQTLSSLLLPHCALFDGAMCDRNRSSFMASKGAP